MFILEIIGGLLILVVLVAVHELGHGIVAHRNGVVVEEFGIGFPPRAWSKKLKNGVLFTLNWLPLGGFVKLQGEHDAANKKGDYGAASFWQKTKILFAGVAVNWVVAAILMTGLAFVGLPKILPNQFSIANDTVQTNGPIQLTSVVANYPAIKSGLQKDDTIVEFAGQPVSDTAKFVTLTHENHGKTVPVVYERKGVKHQTNVALLDKETGTVFGAGLGQTEKIRATWSAPIVGVVTTGQFTWETLKGLGGTVANLATGIVHQFSGNSAVKTQANADLAEVSNSVAGPIGILGTIFPAAEQAGPTQLIFLTAIISLTLAVMNILPIPALDGGSWYTMAIYRLLKKPLTKEAEEKIKGIGFMVLMALIIVITIGDVTKLF